MNKDEVLIKINRIIESNLFEDANKLLDTYDLNEEIYDLLEQHFIEKHVEARRSMPYPTWKQRR